MRAHNLTGRVFGELTGVRVGPRGRYGKQSSARWFCLCSCGNETLVHVQLLLSGRTKSCGCYRKRFRVVSDAPINDLLCQYKRGARDRNLSFELTKEQFVSLTSSRCSYCGCHPSENKTIESHLGLRYDWNGIDRKNNQLGYTVENSLPCCYICNQAKHTLSHDKFIDWLDRVSDFRETL